LFFDIYSSNNFIGVFTFNFIICVYLSFFFAQNIFKKNSISSVVSVFALIIFIYNVLNILFYKTLGIEFEFRILNFLINIIYNTIIAVPVFYSFKKIYAVGTKRI
jgi:CBS domain containing-hemolysin-like protein